MSHSTTASPASLREHISRQKTVHHQYTGQGDVIAWKSWELLLFRFSFIYFFIQAVPLDWKYFRELFSVDITDLYYGDVFNAARYYPRFLGEGDSFLNWAIVGVIALAGSIIWSRVDKQRTEYNQLYYWLRVIVRYRLAIAVIAYGFIKLFPVQAPFPSLSNLNTHYGDFTNWKVFSVSLGAAPFYEKFLGVVEILAGLLLFNRRTATIGAFLIIAFAGNVFLSNLAYEGGEHIYSLYLVALAIFLVAFDARRIWSLVSEHKPTPPNKYHQVYKKPWQRYARVALKSAFIFFFVFIYGGLTYAGYSSNPHTVPVEKGLGGAAGVYDVKEFIINGKKLDYSLTDPVRWKDVVFENWATLSIRSNRPVIADTVATEIIARKDELKLYESAGTTGRHFYHYSIDSINHTLRLVNKNTHYKSESLVLNYLRPDNNTILLSGLNENGDSLRVTLQRINKKYLFPMGRTKPIKL